MSPPISFANISILSFIGSGSNCSQRIEIIFPPLLSIEAFK
jgi:hypothetical protein